MLEPERAALPKLSDPELEAIEAELCSNPLPASHEHRWQIRDYLAQLRSGELRAAILYPEWDG